MRTVTENYTWTHYGSHERKYLKEAIEVARSDPKTRRPSHKPMPVGHPTRGIGLRLMMARLGLDEQFDRLQQGAGNGVSALCSNSGSGFLAVSFSLDEDGSHTKPLAGLDI